MSLLPNQTNLNAAEAIFAPAGSAGGGGGGGANPSFSTITIADGTITTNTDMGFVFQNISTAVIQDAYLGPIPTAPLAAGPGMLNGWLLNSESGTANTITIGSGNDNAGYIFSGTGGNTSATQALFIQATGVYMSSLNVSSINGAVPGGGGGSIPADLACSTLTVNGGATGLSSIFRINANDPNLFTVAVLDSNTSNIASFDLGTIGGRNQFYAPVGQVDEFFTSTMTGTTGQISLNPIGQDSIRLGGLGAPGDITLVPSGGGLINLSGTTNVPTFANISSLNVSSINGAAPGVGGNGGAIGVQSIPDTGPLTLVCDAPGGGGNPTALTTPLAISTVLGHTYTYTAEASIGAGPNQTSASAVQLQFGNNSRFYDQVRSVSTIVGPNQVVSLNWRFIGSGGGNAIYGYAWDPLSNAASTTVILSKQSLTDYGIIL